MSVAADLALPGEVKCVPLSVRTVWIFVGEGRDEFLQEVSGLAASGLRDQTSEGEL